MRNGKTSHDALQQELTEINKILEDHVERQRMDRLYGNVEMIQDEEQEYLRELCYRKMEIGQLLKK